MQNEIVDCASTESGVGAKTIDGGPAFPTVLQDMVMEQGMADEACFSPGMTLRDYFAAHAPTEYLGTLAEQVQKAGDTTTPLAQVMATAAFMYADAMLFERETIRTAANNNVQDE